MTARPLVLVVDDEPSVLLALGRALRGEPYELLLTADPREAARRIREGGVDLLVADFKMPGLEGYELLAEAAASSPGTMRVILTGYPGELLPAAGATLAACVLEKPWDNATLRSALRRVLAAKGIDARPAGTP